MASPHHNHRGLCGVILAAGDGSRIRPISDARPKATLPVGNRALILHHLDALAAAGIGDVIIVIGASGDAIRRIVDADPVSSRVLVRYVEQPERRGIAHAVSCAAPHITSDFVLLLADISMPDHDLGAAVREFRVTGCDCVLGAKRESDPALMARNFCIDVERGRVRRVIEKPRPAMPGLKGVGAYVFTRGIFMAIERTPVSALRGEQEITDAVQVFIDSGADVRAIEVTRDDINVNDSHALLHANLAHLHRTGRTSLIAPDATIHPGASLHHSIVGPSTHIGPDVQLSECLVLEGVSVTTPGAHTRTIFASDCTVRVDAPTEGRASG